MRINCPFCGERDSREFTYRGDASPVRPDAAAGPDKAYEYVYLRDNPYGRHREHWHHSAGCRAWIVVTRDTRTHAIESVEPAPGADPRSAA